MRKRWGVTALIAGLALLFSAGAMPAYADPGNKGDPGNNNPGQNNTNNPGAEGRTGNPGNNNPGQNNTNNPGTEGASGTNANGGTTGGAADGTGGTGGGGNGGGASGGSVGQTGNPPGANGTVKIHDWPEHKNSSDMANDPKVCQFEIHGFGFDGGQTGRWWIQEHKWGNGDPSKAVLTGSYTANGSGDWTSGPHRLGDGHYKLFVEMTHAAGNSGNTVTTYKMKVFKVECPVSGGTTTGGTQSTTGTTGDTEGGTTTGGTTTAGTTGDTEGGTTTGGTTTGGTTGTGSTETTTTGGGTTGGSAAGTTTGGGDTVRTEVTTVVEGGQEVRVIRIFRNEVVVNEIRTPLGAVAGFESAPAGQAEVAVAGSQTAPAALASLASLPSTSTAPDAPLGLIGLVLTSLGAALLRRTETHS